MFKVKYYLNDIELKDNMQVKCSCSYAYGDFKRTGMIKNKNNKLLFLDNDINNKDDWREVDNLFIRILEIVGE